MYRIASKNSLDGTERPGNGSIFPNRFGSVGRTAGIETAGGRNRDPTADDLINPDYEEDAFSAHRFTRSMSVCSACRYESRPGIFKITATMSFPDGNWSWFLRKDSLNHRRIRFRATAAEATFLLITQAKRVCAVGPGAIFSVIHSPRIVFPTENSLRNSSRPERRLDRPKVARCGLRFSCKEGALRLKESTACGRLSVDD